MDISNKHTRDSRQHNGLSPVTVQSIDVIKAKLIDYWAGPKR